MVNCLPRNLLYLSATYYLAHAQRLPATHLPYHLPPLHLTRCAASYHHTTLPRRRAPRATTLYPRPPLRAALHASAA